MFSLTFLTFVIGRLAPGDPILQLMGQKRDPETYARLTHEYGLDRPLLEQYAIYAAGLLHGDFGLSFHYPGRPVRELIEQGLPVSAELGGLAMLLSLLLGLPLGVAAALKQNTSLDIGVVGITLVFYSVPTFVIIPLLWIANLALYRAGYPSLPQAGWGTPQHLVLPVAALAAANVGYIARLTRTSVLEVLREDYVRTARAKGLYDAVVYRRHALRNALIPVVTVVGVCLPNIIAGTVIFEQIFIIPGMGRYLVDAVTYLDYPVIQATNLFFAVLIVAANLVVDVSYGVLDPRIRYR